MININLVYSSCLKHANKMLLGDPQQLTSERKASTSPSSFINHSTLLLERSRAKLLVVTCTRALDRLRTRRRIGSTRRRGNHMHDHSRFQRDINDVTGVSLSLSLSLSLAQALSLYYYSQKSLTHYIGSASALPIIFLAKDHLSAISLRSPACERICPSDVEKGFFFQPGRSQTAFYAL